ncbi:multicopper oxidase domain-containing protein [Actinoplanes sp. KI2]|uniref:multicopper oxidase family protein n=1 Tax=Actinoplanes sp. KI2 TaxID=2983315 RepID=UPI0021D60B05|nr:multicopper oxidase [Actinoplanes sp. KI2]MCU7727770.1 multicopper oxidase domain-containing protein [Actinoplanes sp. KI2]
MPTRRQLLKTGAIAGAAALVPAGILLRTGTALAQPVPGGTLDPTTIPKYVTPLFVIPAMPSSGSTSSMDGYSIAAGRFRQQILPAGFGSTTVLGFGSTTDSRTFHTPAYTIEAIVGRPVRATWWNRMVDSQNNFVPHPLTVDPTVHWANPPGGVSGRDDTPGFTSTPPPYTGPIPLVVHLHGGHTHEDSDGYPEAWTLPAARNIPQGYATVGSYWDRFSQAAHARFGGLWAPGRAVLQYTNDQRATMLWYHSHELGLTRVNVNAGLSGLYLLRGGATDVAAGVLPGPAPRAGDPPGTRYYEIPLVIQDKSFNADGSLFFPTSRGFFGDTPPDGPWLPASDTSPYWNPEFFGNTNLVNGGTWPTLAVEPRRYRFRVLNACNARTYLLKIVTDPTAARPATAALPMWVIGADGGLLPAPAAVDTAWLGVAERLDVIVDFTGLPVGTRLHLINEGPDEPYGGGAPGVDFEPADTGTTGQIMQFVVGPPASRDTSVPPGRLRLPSVAMPGAASVTRTLSLNEMDSADFPDAPDVGLLGTMNPDGTPNPLHWDAPVTENPRAGATEIWEFHNFTDDGHPIHLHLVEFKVLDRRPFGGAATGPQSWESGTKDTVVALPGQTTRIKATFDLSGRFVWHCHILDHEDNDMMRPYQVG